MSGNERKEELSMMSNILWNLCESYNVCLIPHELKDGTKIIVIQDNIDGKKYALVKEEQK